MGTSSATVTADKAYPDHICIYFDNQLIARHTRYYGGHQDIEHRDHA
jgi:hypothetical protein